MDKKTETLNWLDQNKIAYTIIEHEAVFTIDAMKALGIDAGGCVCKNLFLRDARGRRHFLVSLRGEKSVNLMDLGGMLGTRLSFASEERLAKYLNLEKGAVTPLGVLYDTEHVVEVLLDSDLADGNPVGVHPCVNTATVFLSFSDLEGLLRQNGNSVTVTTL